MQGAAWINLLRRIPANLHDALSLGLVTGSEVVVQQLIRMENDFVVVRGRMAGSTAEGRIMLVPYSHMALVALNRNMSEPDMQALLGGAETSEATSDLPAASTEVPAAPPAAEATPAVGDQRVAAPASSSSRGAVSKSVLLARLRERLKEKVK
jgi:hypothetical protein